VLSNAWNVGVAASRVPVYMGFAVSLVAQACQNKAAKKPMGYEYHFAIVRQCTTRLAATIVVIEVNRTHVARESPYFWKLEGSYKGAP
jgi:hypothetical protein